MLVVTSDLGHLLQSSNLLGLAGRYPVENALKNNLTCALLWRSRPFVHETIIDPCLHGFGCTCACQFRIRPGDYYSAGHVAVQSTAAVASASTQDPGAGSAGVGCADATDIPACSASFLQRSNDELSRRRCRRRPRPRPTPRLFANVRQSVIPNSSD
jgi:hypothetical protein